MERCVQMLVLQMLRLYSCTLIGFQLPEAGGETVCEVDDAFEVWPGVNIRMIMGNMTEGGLPY